MRTLPLLLLSVSVNLDALAALGVELPTPRPDDGPTESPTVDGLLNAYGTETEATGLVDVLQAHGIAARLVAVNDGELPAWAVIAPVQVSDRVCGGQPPAPAPLPALLPPQRAGEVYDDYFPRVKAIADAAGKPCFNFAEPLRGHKWDPWGIPDGGVDGPGRWIPSDAPFTAAPGQAVT